MLKHFTKKLFTIVLLSTMLFTMFSGTLTASAEEATETKELPDGVVGEWIWGSTIVEDGAETVVGCCAQAGVTDIYLLVKGTGGKLAYRQTEFTNFTDTDRDVLQETIDAAHARGIRVHAWICNGEDAYYKPRNPAESLRHYTNGYNSNRIALYSEKYREYMETVVRELAAYDIDGLHFDYLRYNHLANGWAQVDFDALEAMGANIARVRELIETTFGYNGKTANSNYVFNAYNAGDKDALLIGEYRRNAVNGYVERMVEAAREVNPDLIFSAATMPEGANNTAYADLHYGQNYADLAEIVDYICPMAYSTTYGQGDTWVVDIAKKAIDKGNKVVMGLQAFDIGDTVKLNKEVKNLNALAKDSKYGDAMLGIALFRNETFDYAAIKVNAEAKTISVTVINSTAKQYSSITIQKGGLFTIKSAELEGFADNAQFEIDADGASVKITGEHLAPDRIATVTLTYEGEINTEVCPVTVRSYTTKEVCVFNSYIVPKVEPQPDPEKPANTTEATDKKDEEKDGGCGGKNSDGDVAFAGGVGVAALASVMATNLKSKKKKNDEE